MRGGMGEMGEGEGVFCSAALLLYSVRVCSTQ